MGRTEESTRSIVGLEGHRMPISPMRPVRTAAILAILAAIATLAACQRVPKLVEVTEPPVITVKPGDQLPPLPQQVDVAYSDGARARLSVAWDVAELTSQRLWSDTVVDGTVADKDVTLTVGQRIAVVPNREAGFDISSLAPPAESMMGVELPELEWSGLEISLELQDQVRSVLIRSKLIEAMASLGGVISHQWEGHILVNGRDYCPVTDSRFPTYAHYLAFLRSTFAGEALTHYLERDLCIQVDGILYCRPDGAGCLDFPSGPTRMKVLAADDQRMTIEISVTMVGPESSFEDVRTRGFHLIDGRWLLAEFD